MMIDTKEEQPEKASYSMVVTLSGMMIDAKEKQPQKA